MTKKIAISLPDEALRKAKAAVRAGKAPNVSNYLAHLIDGASANESFAEMIASWVSESGASRAELRAAEEESRLAFERAGLTRGKGQREMARRKAG
ncbi:MAG TPA: hypothetical protein VGM29_18395 [Polyangiaceae bacterium]